MAVQVRGVTEKDASEIVDLLNPIIAARTLTVMDEQLTLDRQRAFIRSFPERGVLLAAVEASEGRILGIQDVAPLAGGRVFAHVGQVSTFVREEAWGQGIGRLLFEATLEAAHQRGYEKITATVRADNPRALAFYRAQRFREVGTAERHARIDGRYIDEILMERLLDQR